MSLSARRAWIEIEEPIEQETAPESLSARRAWIEITQRRDFKALGLVALRKESVDRNLLCRNLFPWLIRSLSARRAWIEMRMVLFPAPPTMVALRKESVDRNRRAD